MSGYGTNRRFTGSQRDVGNGGGSGRSVDAANTAAPDPKRSFVATKAVAPPSTNSKVERDTDVRTRDARHHAILPACQREDSIAMDHCSVAIAANA